MSQNYLFCIPVYNVFTWGYIFVKHYAKCYLWNLINFKINVKLVVVAVGWLIVSKLVKMRKALIADCYIFSEKDEKSGVTGQSQLCIIENKFVL